MVSSRSRSVRSPAQRDRRTRCSSPAMPRTPTTTRLSGATIDQVGRYGAASKFDPLSAGKTIGCLSVTASPGLELAGTSIWTASHLNDLDGFVFKVRSQLDFEKISFSDPLKAVLERNKRHLLVSSWN